MGIPTKHVVTTSIFVIDGPEARARGHDLNFLDDNGTHTDAGRVQTHETHGETRVSRRTMRRAYRDAETHETRVLQKLGCPQARPLPK